MRCCSECTVVHNTHYPIIYRAELAKEKDQLRRILADDVKRLETQQAVSSKQREEQAVAATQDKEGLAVPAVEVSSLQLQRRHAERLRAAVAVAAGGVGEDPAAGEGGAVAARGGRGGVRRLQTGLLHHKEESSLKTLRQDVLLRVCQQAGVFDVKNYLCNSFFRYCIVK